MKIKSIIILLLISIFTYSQDINIDVKKSEIFKDKKKNTTILFTENDGNGGLIILRSFNGGLLQRAKYYNIEHYNSDLKLVKSSRIENEKLNSINGMLIKDGTINLIQYYNSRKKGITVNLLKSTIKDLNFSKKELFFISIEKFKKHFGFGIGLFFVSNYESLDKDAFQSINYSLNKEFISFSFDLKNDKKETHLFYVYDNKFNKVYETLFETDIKDRLFEFESLDLNEKDGTIYLLGKAFESNSKKTKKKGKTNYHYELFKLTENSKEQINLKEENRFVGSLSLLYKKGNLSLVGFYSEKNDYRYKGVCRYNLNPTTLNVLKKSFKPFSDQFFNDKYKKGSKIRKGKKELKALSYRGVFLDENDNVIINAEEFYISTHYVSNGNGGGYYRYTYHYNDIISVKIDKEGTIIWARNINKAQTNIRNASYTSTIANNEVYFYLNISDKIRKLSNDRISFKQTSTKKSNLYVIKIAENGDFTYKKLIDDKDSKVWYRVNNGILSNNLKSVIFQGSKKKNKQIIKLTIQ